ncbi:VOC family protein [Nonomuraea sp. NPDC059023]|uniref:VOC family protein n=1 Tax=unclassified Nonomuraea TaxID=2593643 RepID=UPI0036A25F05
MTGEKTVPLLPCRSIDEIAEFYEMLGFTKTYRQTRPNPYVTLKRDDIEIGFFGMPDFIPEDSYGSCVVVVPDTGELFGAFAEGMRAAYGKLLVSGIPRMTRPRKRKNADNHSGFTVIDPGGNWIRFMAAQADTGAADADPPLTKLAASIRNAVVMGDSHGNHDQAARILDTALRRDQDTATPKELLEALAYRAELATRADDHPAAREFLTKARQIPLTEADQDTMADTLTSLNDLAAVLRT